MENKRKLLQTLKKEIELLRFKVYFTDTYNKEAAKKRKKYKAYRFIDQKIMYILAYLMCVHLSTFKDNSPFRVDQVEDKISTSMEEIYTSVGEVTTKESEDIDYEDEIFEYTTNWYVNSMGLYEQTTTYYKYNEIKDADPNDLLSMSKEKLDEMFTIIDVRTTIKNSLTEEERMIKPKLTISITKENIEKYYRDENWRELLRQFIYYCMVSEGLGAILTIVKRKITKNGIQERLEELIGEYEVVSPEDIPKLKQELEAKLDKYDLLTSEDENQRIRRNR